MANLPAWTFFEALDHARRLQGAAMDALGYGPDETPYRVVFSEAGVRLRYYGTADRAAAALLIVPAPIKRPYIWDLAPGVSAVRRCLQTGLRVFLLEWQSDSAELGLGDYAVRLILDCMAAAGIGSATLVAHSLGGLFAAIFAALQPQRVRALAMLATPLHLGASAAILHAMASGFAAGDLPPRVPGSFLSTASLVASPLTFGWDRWLDLWRSLPAPAALRSHLQVERWTLDELALPRRLLGELAALLAPEDRFARGMLIVEGRRVLPRAITAPLLCVLDPRCRVVPPQSVLPFYDAVASRDKTLLHYHGDVGVSLQHVGVLAGREAHRRLWPQIVHWIRARSSPGGGR